MGKRVLGWGGWVGVAVGGGVAEQGGDGAGGVVGEGGPDGDLVLVVPVEGLDVERGEQGFFDLVGGVCEQGGGDGEQVKQGRVVVGGCCCLEVCQGGFDAGAFGVQV